MGRVPDVSSLNFFKKFSEISSYLWPQTISALLMGPIMKKIKNVKTAKEFRINGDSPLEEINHEDDYGEYFTPITTDSGGIIQYARSLDREGVSYVAPDILDKVWYYEAFPIRGAEIRWHYCVFDPLEFEHGDGRGPVAVGYCDENCLGHPTEEEAREHFRQYILDKCEFVTALSEGMKCRVCGSSAKNVAELASFLGQMGFVTIPSHDRQIPLCASHSNRDALDKLFLLSDFQEFVSV